MGGHVNRNTSTPVGRVTRNALWPTCHPSGSSASKPTNHSKPEGRQTVVVPNFMSKPQDYLPSKYGYQKVHTIYDEMRDFFCKKGYIYLSKRSGHYQSHMMKSNCRNPQMVMVRKLLVYDSTLSKIICKGHFGNHF